MDHAAIATLQAGVTGDRMAFLDGFCTNFFSAAGALKVSQPQREYARDIAAFASPKGTLDCIDAIVPFEVSGKRSAAAIAGAELVVVKGAPHGFNASHAKEFKQPRHPPSARPPRPDGARRHQRGRDGLIRVCLPGNVQRQRRTLPLGPPFLPPASGPVRVHVAHMRFAR